MPDTMVTERMAERPVPHRLAVRAALTAAILMVCGAAIDGPRAIAQIQSVAPESYLQVESVVAQPKGGKPRVTGYVYNTRDLYATRVQLFIEALDAAGQVVASSAAWVYGDVPPRTRSYFDAPVSAAGSTYRVTVRSVDWRGYGAGGG